MDKWYSQTVKNNDIIISSRVRLTRNIEDFPFPHRMSASDAGQLLMSVSGLMSQDGFEAIRVENLPGYRALALCERGILQPEMLGSAKTGAVISPDESTVINICDGEHIKITVRSSGAALDGCFDTANFVDDKINSIYNYAFNDTYGYLLSSPLSSGTGLSVSLMLHLFALSENAKELFKLRAELEKVGITLKAADGDGLASGSDMYILSNSVGYGIPEKQAIENLKSFARQLATKERIARDGIEEGFLKNRIEETLNELKNGDGIGYGDLTKALSVLRAGALSGLINLTGKQTAALLRLYYETSTANLIIHNELCLNRDYRHGERLQIAKTELEL